MKHLILIIFVWLIIANCFAQSKPPSLADRDFVFDSTKTFQINHRKYYKASEFYILSTSISKALIKQCQGKLVNIFGVIQYVQGKTMIKKNGNKIASKDFYQIIENPRMKNIEQNIIEALDQKTFQKERFSEISADNNILKNIKEEKTQKPIPKPAKDNLNMQINEEVNFVSEGVNYSDQENIKSNSLLDVKKFPTSTKTYPFMKNWQFVNHVSFKPQWITIIHNNNQNANKLENLTTKDVVNVIIAKTEKNDTIRIINIDYQKKIPTNVFRLFVTLPKKIYEGFYTLPEYKEKGIYYINAFGLDNKVKKTYFLDVVLMKKE